MVTKSVYSLSFVLALWGAIVALPVHSALADGGPEGTPGTPQDLDGDGFSTEFNVNDPTADCDDHDASIHPGATDLADGIDNDCDNIIDNGDQDGDGFAVSEDCDDTDASVNPGMQEVPYDYIDQDCDRKDLTDVDHDGHDSFVVGGDDYGDYDPSTYPGATEVLDGKDNNLDGIVDNVDLDGDGFTAVEGDLDDNDGSVYPGAPELEDGIDNDCDGIVDNGFEDLDEDGFAAFEDCDDTNVDIYPGAVEILGDGIDNDCDNSIEQTMSISGILNGEDQWELLPLAWTQNLPQTLSFTIEVGGSAMSEPNYTIVNGGATYWIDTESGFCRAYEQTASGLQLLYYYNAMPSGQCSLVLNTAGQSPVELTILAHSMGFAAAYTVQWMY